MSVQVCAIASGSNGNCYYVGSENEAILVDAGVGCKEIEGCIVNAGWRCNVRHMPVCPKGYEERITFLPILV